jgi:hypothetical protein
MRAVTKKAAALTNQSNQRRRVHSVVAIAFHLLRFYPSRWRSVVREIPDSSNELGWQIFGRSRFSVGRCKGWDEGG